MPKISVIIPVYNASKVLERCIDSILSQSFSDFELILVNDGSTDTSGIICDTYAKKDARVRVEHQPNGGVSMARNKGIALATGEWLAFIDADDSVTEAYLSNLICYASQDVSLVVSNCKVVNRQTITNGHTESEDTLLTSEQMLRKLLNGNNVRNEVWAKLFSKSFIGDCRFYSDLRIGEDLLFIMMCCKNNEGKLVRIVPNSDYYYYMEDGSAMNRSIDLTEEYERLIDAVCNELCDMSIRADIAIFKLNQIWAILDRYKWKRFKLPAKYNKTIEENLKYISFDNYRVNILRTYARNIFVGYFNYVLYKFARLIS